MTQLRKMMIEELERRNFAETTKQCYIQAVEEFAAYFHRPPDQLGPEQIREFQAYLFRTRKLAPNTVNQRLAALRFFFVKTLKRNWNADETPYPKKVINLPIVLSQEEVARLIDSAEVPFHRVLLMTLYATGLRRAELAHLKVGDIDSAPAAAANFKSLYRERTALVVFSGIVLMVRSRYNSRTSGQ